MGRVLAFLALSILVSCGGGRADRGSAVTRFAATDGPIKAACVSSRRSAANNELCGCIQVAADQTLTRADQQRGAPFFSDPALAHEVRLSDTERDDAFWERWTNFGKAATQLCE